MLPFLSDPEYSSELEELDGTRDLCPDFQTLAQEKLPKTKGFREITGHFPNCAEWYTVAKLKKKVYSGFSTRWYGKVQMNYLANPY